MFAIGSPADLMTAAGGLVVFWLVRWLIGSYLDDLADEERERGGA